MKHEVRHYLLVPLGHDLLNLLECILGLAHGLIACTHFLVTIEKGLGKVLQGGVFGSEGRNRGILGFRCVQPVLDGVRELNDLRMRKGAEMINQQYTGTIGRMRSKTFIFKK